MPLESRALNRRRKRVNSREWEVAGMLHILVLALLTLSWAIAVDPAMGANDTLRVGIYQNAPKIFRDEAGQPQGFWPDLIEEISRQKGWAIKYVTCEWTECLMMLEKAEIDVMPDVAYSPMRAARFSFGKEAVFHSWSQVFHQPGKNISGILDLSGLRIAVLSGSIQEERLGQRLKQFGIDTRFVSVKSLRATLSAVRDGTADVAVVNRFLGARLAPEFGVVPSGVVVAPSAVHFAFAPGLPSWVIADFDTLVANLKLEGHSIYYKGLASLVGSTSRFSVPAVVYWVIGIGLGALCLSFGAVVILRRAVTQRTQELRKSRETLRKLALSLQELREQERTAIAREIHDELGQALTGLRIDLAWLMDKLPKNRSELHDRGHAMVNQVDSTVNDVRRIASSLRPAILDDLGLAAAIEWMASEFGERTGMRCLVDVEDLDPSWGTEGNTAAFRIFQEALTNISRHAGATKVEVSLKRKGDEVTLEITDDGVGINDAALSDPRSLGLLGMRERAAALGWRLDIVKNLGGGTMVALRIPHPPQQVPADSG